MTTQNEAHVVADDLVHWQFWVSEPNTVWAADMSVLPTKEGWLYLATILDLHSRPVGWAQEGPSQVKYLEIFYNRQRRHRALGDLTPVEFEQRRNRALA